VHFSHGINPLNRKQVAPQPKYGAGALLQV
jgi:hypothetical protein